MTWRSRAAIATAIVVLLCGSVAAQRYGAWTTISAAVAVAAASGALIAGRDARGTEPVFTGAAGIASLAGTAGILLTGSTYSEGDRAATYWSLVETAALLALTTLAIRVAPRRRAVIAAGLSGIAVPAWLLRFGWGPLTAAGLGGYAAWASLSLLSVSVGLYLRAQDERRRRSVAQARRAQRVDLARDLHDFVAHEISGMLAQAQAGQVVAERESAAADAFQRIEQAGRRALESMDQTVRMLDDTAAGDAGDSPPTLLDLPDAVARFAAVGPDEVQLDLDPHLAGGALPPEVATTAYRIVIEALTNVRRHAPTARSVTVSIRHASAGPGVEIVVCDDGQGAESLPDGRRGGRGLVGLTQRVEDLGGTLTAGPAEPIGWRARAFLPLPQRGRWSRA